MSRKLDDVLVELDSARDSVPRGSKHVKTNALYTVKDIVVIESELTLAVSYNKLTVSPQFNWIRPLDEFLDGRFERMNLFKDE